MAEKLSSMDNVKTCAREMIHHIDRDHFRSPKNNSFRIEENYLCKLGSWKASPEHRAGDECQRPVCWDNLSWQGHRQWKIAIISANCVESCAGIWIEDGLEICQVPQEKSATLNKDIYQSIVRLAHTFWKSWAQFAGWARTADQIAAELRVWRINLGVNDAMRCQLAEYCWRPMASNIYKPSEAQ